MNAIKLPLTDRATLIAKKMGDAPVAGLWTVRIVRADDEQPLGNATAAEFRKLLRLRSPNELELFPASDGTPACAYVMMFYDELGPRTTMYAIPVEDGVELAWSKRGTTSQGSVERSGIIVKPATVASWASSIECAQDRNPSPRSKLVV